MGCISKVKKKLKIVLSWMDRSGFNIGLMVFLKTLDVVMDTLFYMLDVLSPEYQNSGHGAVKSITALSLANVFIAGILNLNIVQYLWGRNNLVFTLISVACRY